MSAPEPGRGSVKRGFTTAKIKDLPHGGIFVWGTEDLDYPKALATFLGREDIQIVGPSWLRDWQWNGQRYSGIVLDHAYAPSGKAMDNFFQVKMQVRN